MRREENHGLSSPDARGKLEGIDKQSEVKTKVVSAENLDALQQYFKRLHDETGNWGQALAGVKANALQGLEDGLLGLVNGTESVSSAFKKMVSSIIADMARIVIQKAILSVFGLKDGGPVGSVGHYATGGFVSGPGGPRDDRIPAMLSNGEFVMNAAAVRRYGPAISAMNAGTVGHFADGGFVGVSYPSIPSASSLRLAPVVHQHFTIDAKGSVLANDLMVNLQRMSAAHAQAAVLGGAGLAQQQANEAAMQRLA